MDRAGDAPTGRDLRLAGESVSAVFTGGVEKSWSAGSLSYDRRPSDPHPDLRPVRTCLPAVMERRWRLPGSDYARL